MSENASQCPFSGANTAKGTSATEQWWPEQAQPEDPARIPLKPSDGEGFDYAAELSRSTWPR